MLTFSSSYKQNNNKPIGLKAAYFGEVTTKRTLKKAEKAIKYIKFIFLHKVQKNIKTTSNKIMLNFECSKIREIKPIKNLDRMVNISKKNQQAT